jgi:hypothetical protein
MDRKQGRQSFFQVGQSYTNRNFTYAVLAVLETNDSLCVRREDGTIAILIDLGVQQRMVENWRREIAAAIRTIPTKENADQRVNSIAQNDDFHFWLGFLAVRAAALEAHVPLIAQKQFEVDYQQCTGEEAEAGADYYYLLKTKNKRWYDLRVVFAATETEIAKMPGGVAKLQRFTDRGKDKSLTVRCQYRIGENVFVRALFSSGFRLGSGARQKLERIRASVPTVYKRRFEAGISLARGAQSPAEK